MAEEILGRINSQFTTVTGRRIVATLPQIHLIQCAKMNKDGWNFILIRYNRPLFVFFRNIWQIFSTRSTLSSSDSSHAAWQLQSRRLGHNKFPQRIFKEFA